MLQQLQAAVAAHWHALMVALAVWIALATVIARRWPKPDATAKWYLKAAHFALVDLPALAATLNGKTWMGLTVSIPFITWTVRDPGKDPPNVIKLLLPFAIGFTFGLALFGCAAGTDGLRQGCANTDAVLEGSYSTTGALIRADLPRMRGALPGGGQAALDRMHAHEAAYGKTLGVLDSGRSLKEATCKAADGVDAMKQKDIDAAMATLAQIAAKVEQAVAELKGELK